MKKNFQFSIFNFQKRAFTLVEAMVAVTIITIAVAGPMFTANRSIVAARISRDQLTASYLAQEGIEYVRAIRDDNYLAVYNTPNESAAWANFLTAIGQCRTPGICTLGLAQGDGTLPRIPCPNNVCTTTFSLLANGTPYKRTIQTVGVTANDERIVSTVSWSFHGTPYTVTINDHLTPWQ